MERTDRTDTAKADCQKWRAIYRSEERKYSEQ